MGKGQDDSLNYELHRRYGEFVRIGPNELIISQKEALNDIYGTIAGKGYTKTSFYDAFTAFRPTLFGQRDNHLHAERKRIVGNGYSNQSIHNMEQYIHVCMNQFMNKMSQFAVEGSDVDLCKWVHFFAFDVIGELAFSESFGMLDSGTMDEHAVLIGHQLDFGSTLGLAPFLLPLTKSKWVPWPWVQRIQAGREKLKTMTRLKAERRKSRQLVDRQDILGRLLEAFDSETGKTLDEIDVRTEAFSSIVAGSDSTSAALAFTFFPYFISSRGQIADLCLNYGQRSHKLEQPTTHGRHHTQISASSHILPSASRRA